MPLASHELIKVYETELLPTLVEPLVISFFSFPMAHLQAQHNPGSSAFISS